MRENGSKISTRNGPNADAVRKAQRLLVTEKAVVD